MVCPISSENTCHCSQCCVWWGNCPAPIVCSHSVGQISVIQSLLMGWVSSGARISGESGMCLLALLAPAPQPPCHEAMEGELQLFMTVLTLLDSWEVLPVVETKACHCLWSMKCTAFHWIHSNLSMSCFQQVINQPWTPFSKLQFCF